MEKDVCNIDETVRSMSVEGPNFLVLNGFLLGFLNYSSVV
jgi:hypothetical protein